MNPNGHELDEISRIRTQNVQMRTVLDMRATVLFGQIIEAVNARKQQALSGDHQARADLLMFCKMFDLDELRAAAMGIARP